MGWKPLESSNLFPSAITSETTFERFLRLKLGSSRRRESKKRRQRLIIGLVKWSILLGLVLAAGIYAWYTGSSVARREVTSLTEQNEALTRQVHDLQQQLGESKGREAVLQQQLPTEQEQKILAIIRDRIAAGVLPERLAEVAAAATAERNCAGQPEGKRFRVRTPVSDPTGSAASFADATITVTAEGIPATDDDGRPEAWFDVDQPVTVTFLHVNGTVSRAEGLLPLTHAIAVGNTEYRFQVAAGIRSFVVVSMDRCAYP